MGSGAGFPALVLAILGWDVVAIESISKKVRFLEEVKSQLNLTNFNVVNDRVENVITGRQVEQVDQVERLNTCPICSTCLPVYTARAFAPLVKILDYVGAVGGRPVLYLLKGANVMEEIRMAQEKYKFEYELYPSKTGDGFVVKIVF
jgi:16S rRNA (guanine527-N7)-methyltransferase